MANAAAKGKLNQLLDQVESGSLSVLDFVQGVSGIPDYLDGLGPHVNRATGGARAMPKGKLVYSRVLMRVKSVDPNGDNHVEGSVLSGAVPFTQIMKRGKWHQVVTRGTGELVVTGGPKAVLKQGDSMAINAGKSFEFHNTGNQPWDFMATHSSWHPDTFVYELNNQKYSGDQLWFSIKTSNNDQTQRPAYNIRSSTAGTFSIALLEPGQSTIPCYYTDGDNVVTALLGEGTLSIGQGKGAQPLKRGDAHTVPTKQPFHLTNNGKGTLLVEIRPTPPREWRPETSFWEASPGHFVTGDQVYFEYVFPTP